MSGDINFDEYEKAYNYYISSEYKVINTLF